MMERLLLINNISQLRGKSMNIVCIGGGHGLAQVLSAIKPVCHKLTAIVATTDNGGSTGKIRQLHDCIALGDIRRCCVQLADKLEITKEIYEYRFTSGEFKGHCLGNLVLLNMLQESHSATAAIAKFNKLLDNSETVLPMTESPADLVAVLSNGDEVFGECAIDALNSLPDKVYLSNKVSASPGCVEAILNADLVIIGPGSIISSVMPALLIDDILQAVEKTSACRIFIENTAEENSVMKHTQSAGIDWLQEQLGSKIYDLSISPSAISEILASDSHFKNHSNHLHDISELNHIFCTFLKSSIEESPLV